MEIGEKIRKIRIGKDISQEYLSKILGVSQNTIHKIETGKKELTVTELFKISEILNVSIDKLIDLPKNQEFSNCKDSGNVINIQFPPEILNIFEKLIDKL